MTPSRRHFLALSAAVGTAAMSGSALAGPASSLIDDRWTRHGSGGDPDHGAWGSYLSRYLRTGTSDGVNLFDYAGAAGDRGALKGYLDAMQKVAPTSLSRDAAMAYWLNLYNAVTIDVVLDAYPVSSIRKVNGGLFNTGPWGDDVIRIEGQDLSLDDIEHGILRPVWRDARIHYGVNCASIGCPNLAAKPYVSGRLNAMLDQGARDYAAHPRGATVAGGEVIMSSIYDWFIEDFGGNEAGAIAHVASFAPAAKAEALAGRTDVDDYRYDWALNDAAGAAG